MALDFSKLKTKSTSDTVLSPRELFSLLPSKQAKYRYLRDVQAEVLDAWFARRNERDTVIRMNTGSGKTVVGLLTLKSCLNEGVGTAAYITPDNYLADQVRQEAAALGIEVTDDPRSAEYLRGRAIFVGNVYKLINGRSVFGVGDEGVKIPIGSLIVDDAHACLADTESQFTLVIDANHAAYAPIYNLLRSYLHQQSVRAYAIEANEPGKFMLVPFWAWAEKLPSILPILHEHRESDELKFTWPLVQDSLRFCQCVIGEGRLEISPPCIPISVIRSFESATRRVFMSATLSDDSVLISHFDVAVGAIAKAVTPSLASDIGDRMILVPQELNASIGDTDMKAMLGRLAAKHNVVVIVPSVFRAQFWSDVAKETLAAKSLREGVDQLRNGHVGLVVLINKYDGVDLPYDACRILVIDGLPDVRRGLDHVEQSILNDSSLTMGPRVQRVEQGMGRGVRANDDYCVVFLMGRSLIGNLYVQRALDFMTPATRAQMDLSNQLAEQVRGRGVSAVEEAIAYCLDRQPEWLVASKSILAGLKYRTEAAIDPIVAAQRRAYDAALIGNYQEAVTAVQDVANAETNLSVRGWLKLQLAAYTYLISPVEAQRILKSGLADNKHITRPMEGIQYTKLATSSRSQAERCSEFLRGGFTDPNGHLLEINSLTSCLIFQRETADAFELAMKKVASYLGFDGQRPEAEFGSGPDVLWELGGLKYFVIEAKNGAVVETISKEYCNQLGGSVNWFEREYDKSCSCIPLMVHPGNVTERTATPPAGTRIIEKNSLPKLAEAIRTFATSAITSKAFQNTQSLHQLLINTGLTAEGIVNRFSVDAYVPR